MTKISFTISLDQQQCINDLWSLFTFDKQCRSNVGMFAFKEIIIQRMDSIGIDCDIPVDELYKVFTSGYTGDFYELSRMFFSALAFAYCELKDMASKEPPLPTFPILPRIESSPHKDRQVISFVIFSAMARKLSFLCDTDWSTGTAACVAHGFGELSKTSKYGGLMSSIFDCIFFDCSVDAQLCQEKTIEIGKEENDVKSDH